MLYPARWSNYKEISFLNSRVTFFSILHTENHRIYSRPSDVPGSSTRPLPSDDPQGLLIAHIYRRSHHRPIGYIHQALILIRGDFECFWRDAQVLNNANRLSNIGNGSPFSTTRHRYPVCTTSNCPRRESGIGFIISNVSRLTFLGNHFFGGNCAVEISYPWRRADGYLLANSLAKSTSQILHLNINATQYDWGKGS